jgi:hypothetical protein
VWPKKKYTKYLREQPTPVPLDDKDAVGAPASDAAEGSQWDGVYEEAQGAKVDRGHDLQHFGVHTVHGDEEYRVGDSLDTFVFVNERRPRQSR